jgi:mRNA deadenylase 3'-5' endonuclease subunit Ccr4/uncharacterized protein with PIN domain
MAATFGSAVDAAEFQSGYDLNALFQLGKDLIWKHIDHEYALGTSVPDAPGLPLFVELAQLDPSVFESYREYAIKQMPAVQQQEQQQQPASSSTSEPDYVLVKSPPPAPPLPPCIPAPLSCSSSTDAGCLPSASSQGASKRSFSFASWNILSADYAHPSTFFYCPREALEWGYRRERILALLNAADIEAMQEVDYDAVASGVFDSPAHSSVFLRRPGAKRDGCMLRWRKEVFELLPIPHLLTLDSRFLGKVGIAGTRRENGVRLVSEEARIDTLQPRVGKKAAAAMRVSTSSSSSVAVPAAASIPLDPAAQLRVRQETALASLDALEQRIEMLAARVQLHVHVLQSQHVPVPEAATRTLSEPTFGRSISEERQMKIAEHGDEEEGASSGSEEEEGNSTSSVSSAANSPTVQAAAANLSPPPLAATAAPSEEPGSDVLSACTISPPIARQPSTGSNNRYYHAVQFNDLGYLTRSKSNCSSTLFSSYKRENIAVAILLRHRASGRLVLAANAHLFWNPDFACVKTHQAMYLLQQLEELRKLVVSQHCGVEVAVLLGGDFNSTPRSNVYRLLTSGEAEIENAASALAALAERQLQTQDSTVPIVSSPFHDVVFAAPAVEVSPSAMSLGVAPAATATETVTTPAATQRHGKTYTSASTAAADAVSGAGAATDSSSSLSTSAPGDLADSSPNASVRLLLDNSLSRVSKWLRAIGVSTWVAPSTPQTDSGFATPAQVTESVEKFFKIARREGRVIISQNKGLLKRRALAALPHFLPPTRLKDSVDIFGSICERFGFAWDSNWFYKRCTTCNSLVTRLELAEYSKLPFLPSEYKSGLDDSGEPLYITRCQNPGCARVRWWSSSKQYRTRVKLFQVRMDMDVSDIEVEETEQREAKRKESAADTEEKEQTAAPHPLASAACNSFETDILGSSSSSTRVAATDAAPASRLAPQVARPDSPTSIAAQRVARKAAKAELKASRMEKSAARKAQLASSIAQQRETREEFLKSDTDNATEEKGGSIMFDYIQSRLKEPGFSDNVQPPQQPYAMHTQKKIEAEVAAAMRAAEEDGLDISAIAPLELWWTKEKKEKMIEVEKRIIAETRRTILARRARKAAATAATLAGASGQSLENGSAAVLQMRPNRETLSPESDVGNSAFCSLLQKYWQSVADKQFTPTGSSFHRHSLELASAYAADDGEEPPFTNATPKFLDTIDYLFYSKHILNRKSVRPLPTMQQLEARDEVGYPTKDWPSDHCLLQAELEFA